MNDLFGPSMNMIAELEERVAQLQQVAPDNSHQMRITQALEDRVGELKTTNCRLERDVSSLTKQLAESRSLHIEAQHVVAELKLQTREKEQGRRSEDLSRKLQQSHEAILSTNELLRKEIERRDKELGDLRRHWDLQLASVMGIVERLKTEGRNYE